VLKLGGTSLVEAWFASADTHFTMVAVVMRINDNQITGASVVMGGEALARQCAYSSIDDPFAQRTFLALMGYIEAHPFPQTEMPMVAFLRTQRGFLVSSVVRVQVERGSVHAVIKK
jgi:hypothetical protein